MIHSVDFLIQPQAPFLPGDSDLGQLSKIFEIFGAPTEDVWPVCTVLYAHACISYVYTVSIHVGGHVAA